MSLFNPSIRIATVVNFLLICLANAQNTSAIYLPSLNNSTHVGVRTFPLVDKHRLDPFTNFTQHREIMLSLYYPAEYYPSELHHGQQPSPSPNALTTRYMPNATAAIYDANVAQYGVPNGSFERLHTLCQTNAPISTRKSSFPLILFSPGLGNSRLLYTTIAQEVARNGYIVASIDHPYDAQVVEFPDGRLVFNPKFNFTGSPEAVLALINENVAVRVQDVSFLLDALSSPSARHPFEIDSKKVVMFGHSFGGTTAASAMVNETRIAGGLNFDGDFYGAIVANGSIVRKPFLLFEAARPGVPRPNWDDAWNNHFQGWKLDVELFGGVHGSFEDLPLLADILGLRAALGKAGDAVLGTVPGLRGLQIMSDYVSAFAEFVFSGEKAERGDLVDGKNSTRYPEVGVVRFARG